MIAKILTGLAGNLGAAPIDALAGLFDRLFTSDDERAQAAIVLEKLRQHPNELQVELNKVEAQHRSLFVAGWRPAIGWVCAGALACYYLPQFALASVLWVRLAWGATALPPYPVTEIAGLTELVVALLGLAGLRTLEKATGRAR